MKEPRRLALKREALTPLATSDLENVVGANVITNTCTDALKDSVRICSLQCRWTVNTCEAC